MKNPFKKWGTSPESDWQVMFSIFLALILVSIVCSAFFFTVVRDTTREEDEVGAEVLNQNALHRAALYYDAKQAEFDRIKSTPETTPDPSL